MNFLCVSVCVAAATVWCVSGRAQAPSQRMVFAHYMLTNQDYQGDDRTPAAQELKIAAYEREIEEARAAGVDGFALNAGGWLHETYYIRYAAQMFEAAARLNNGFKLMFSADMCCGDTAADVEDMVRRFAGNPRYAPVYFRYGNAFVLTTFSGEKLGVSFWQQVRNDLLLGTNPSTSVQPSVLPSASGAPHNDPLPIFLVPAFFWGGELPQAAALNHGMKEWRNTIDGAFYWGIAGLPGTRGPLDTLRSSEEYVRALRQEDKFYMAPIAPAFWGANADRYYEYNGYEGMRAMWKHAAEVTKPPWVEVITWNDFMEGTYVSPMDDPNRYPNANFLTSSGIPLGKRGYFHSHVGFTALLPWFIEWYKTGSQPRIHHEMVAIAYRTVLGISKMNPHVDRIYGQVGNSLYITANLKAPAVLVIHAGEQEQRVKLREGSHDLRVVLRRGPPPRVELRRKLHLICEVRGADHVVQTARYNNLYESTAVCAPVQ